MNEIDLRGVMQGLDTFIKLYENNTNLNIIEQYILQDAKQMRSRIEYELVRRSAP